MKSQKNQILGAAVAGILGASVMMQTSTAVAADKVDATVGQCVGANSCKGKGACAQAGKHDCASKNSCKGQGFVEKTKAECDKLAKADAKSKITFHAGGVM